jgi:hypothetical protein
MKKFQMTSSPRDPSLPKSSSSPHCCYSPHHHPMISQLYSTNLPLLNKLILLNTATLESLKNSLASPSSPAGRSQLDPKTNADHEHTQALILTFFKTILYLWGHEIGDKDGAIVQALTGPFLAQLVQSCLIFSQHRSALEFDDI